MLYTTLESEVAKKLQRLNKLQDERRRLLHLQTILQRNEGISIRNIRDNPEVASFGANDGTTQIIKDVLLEWVNSRIARNLSEITNMLIGR